MWMFFLYLAACLVFYAILYRIASIEPPIPDPYRDRLPDGEGEKQD